MNADDEEIENSVGGGLMVLFHFDYFSKSGVCWS